MDKDRSVMAMKVLDKFEKLIRENEALKLEVMELRRIRDDLVVANDLLTEQLDDCVNDKLYFEDIEDDNSE